MQDSEGEIVWQMHKISQKVTSSNLANVPISLHVKDGQLRELFGRATIDITSAMTASGQWVDLSGTVEDSLGHQNGMYNMLVRFRPHSMPPDDDGFLEIQTVRLNDLKNNGEFSFFSL